MRSGRPAASARTLTVSTGRSNERQQNTPAAMRPLPIRCGSTEREFLLVPLLLLRALSGERRASTATACDDTQVEPLSVHPDWPSLS